MKKILTLIFVFVCLAGMSPNYVMAQEGVEAGTAASLGLKSAAVPLEVTAEAVSGMVPFFGIVGQFELSVDAIGSTGATPMPLEINKPSATAAVHRAYLLSASTWNPMGDGCVSFGGNIITWTGMVTRPWFGGVYYFYNYWADVTAIVQPVVDPLPAGISSMPVTELCSSSNIEGEVLLVIFADPAATQKTISILWGGLSTTGDNFSISLADPIDPADPASRMDMGLGISFGHQPSGQYSIVDVNGLRLTTAAGGEDDGLNYDANGSLITVGGIGDTNANPADPNAFPTGPRSDDELYNLLPFTTSTTTTMSVSTLNPSDDDNVFLAYFVISGEAIVVVDCINPTDGGVINNETIICKGDDPVALTSVSLPTGHTGNLEYKWQQSVSGDPLSFVDIPMSNSATFDPAVLTQTTWFKRLARVDCMPDWIGAAESNVVYIKVKAPPAITMQPVNMAVCIGGKANFSIKATGDDIQYQWYKVGTPDVPLLNGGNIYGATSSSLTISPVAVADAADYYVVVSNLWCDPATSDIAKLAVKEMFVYPYPVQVTDPVTFTVILWNGATGFPEYTGVMFNVDGVPQTLWPIPLGISDNNKKAAFTRIAWELPGVRIVSAEFKDAMNSTLGCVPQSKYFVTCEDAEIAYNGVEIQSTPTATSTKAMVRLIAVISEDNDGYPWLITWPAPCITFNLYEGTNSTPSYSVVAQVNATLTPMNYLTGIASAWLEIDLGSQDYRNFTIEVVNQGCNPYYCDKSPNYATLLVYKPVGDFITGGGHIITNDSYGLFKGGPDTHTNFGFHVKFNKKGTNLLGGMNIIYRREIMEMMHEYQIKANDMLTLGVNVTNPDDKLAVFTSKANLRDLTTGFDVEGNLRLYVTMTDRGEPGENDQIGITLWRVNSRGKPTTMLYSSSWNGAKTMERLLAGGNLVVHSGFSIATKAAEMAEVQSEYGFMAYPNPFTDRVRFELIPEGDTHARIEMFDMTGRLVETVMNREVKSGITYNAEFVPVSQVTGTYIYRLTLGNEVEMGKVLYCK